MQMLARSSKQIYGSRSSVVALFELSKIAYIGAPIPPFLLFIRCPLLWERWELKFGLRMLAPFTCLAASDGFHSYER